MSWVNTPDPVRVTIDAQRNLHRWSHQGDWQDCPWCQIDMFEPGAVRDGTGLETLHIRMAADWLQRGIRQTMQGFIGQVSNERTLTQVQNTIHALLRQGGLPVRGLHVRFSPDGQTIIVEQEVEHITFRHTITF